MIRHPSLILMLAFVLRSFCIAAEPGAAVKQIAPFVDQQTIAVVHLDTQRLDADALHKKLEALTGTAKLDAQQQQQADDAIGLAMPVLKKGLVDFKKAGARHVYFVFTMSDILSSPGFAVVPLEQGADAKAIAALLFSGRTDGPTSLGPNQTGWPETAEEVKGAVVLGTRGMIKRLGERKPEALATLEPAFAAAGDAPFGAVILMPDDVRKVIDSFWPFLPPELGSKPTTPITRGFVHAALGIDFPPQLSVKLTIQGKDGKAAQDIGDLLDDLITTAGKEPRLMRQVPGLDALLPNLGPKIEGDKVVLSLDEANSSKLLETVVALMGRARQRATHMLAINNARQIVLGGLMYSQDNKGQWPQTLEELSPKYIPAQFLKAPNPKATFEYVKPPPKGTANPQRFIVVYEKSDGNQPVAAGFLDGHAELIKPEDLQMKLQAGQQK
jgi:hypothetical protein